MQVLNISLIIIIIIIRETFGHQNAMVIHYTLGYLEATVEQGPEISTNLSL